MKRTTHKVPKYPMILMTQPPLMNHDTREKKTHTHDNTAYKSRTKIIFSVYSMNVQFVSVCRLMEAEQKAF